MRTSKTNTPPPGATLFVSSMATALVLVVFTVPLTTLTDTVRALGAGPGEQAWILSAMSVGAAAGLLGTGAIGDDYGRRRVFLAGTLVMALASVLGALAPSARVLIVARILQGLGGSAILSCGLGLIGQAFPGKALAHASALWAGALGAGVAAGPILAAGLDTWGGWAAPYWVSGVAALAVAVAGRLMLAESVSAKPRPVDVGGTLLLSLGMLSILGGLTQSRTGWSQPSVVLLLLAGCGMLVAFVFVETRIQGPMLDLSLFRRPDFTGATLAALASGAGVLSLMSLVPVMIERAMGAKGMTAAFVLLAWSATTSVVAIGAKWLPLPPRKLLIGGLLGCALGQLAVWGLGPGSTVFRLLPGLFLAGAANGILNAALGRQAVASVPADRSAMGSGANNTARYLGSATGLTICAVVLAHSGSLAGPSGLWSGWNTVVLITVGFSLLGAFSIVAIRPTGDQPQSIG